MDKNKEKAGRSAEKKEKDNKNSGRMMAVSEVSARYNIPKSMIRRYFPKGSKKQITLKNGHRIYINVWSDKMVQKALKHPVIAEHLRKAEEMEKERKLILEAQSKMKSYSPDYYIEKAREKKRSFVLHVGPTNSGKTYDAIEDMKKNSPGTYLGPLRLLALEMYDKINAAGIPCSMITGEESLITPDARIISSTIELADTKSRFKTAVIDEAQLISDPFRGASWLKAICLVDAEVVHICMAPEALNYIENLIKSFGAEYAVKYHERLAPLTYSGSCKDYKDLREGDALICFSRKNVLSTAALLEKNGFRASVIYGALPPEARRNEVRKYMEKETNIVVATDAIGMGISLPIKRVIFTETEKFDGKNFRELTTAEVKQIGGRAGRYGLNEFGEVLTLGDSNVIASRFDGQVKDVKVACISFPRNILEEKYPLGILLKAWQRMPKHKEFVRENMSDAEILLKAMEKRAKSKNGVGLKVLDEKKELVYDLISCPVDVKSDELVEYFVRCTNAILKGKNMPLPYFGTDELAECELEYRAYDLRHQLLRRIGQEDPYSHMRAKICDRIAELMKEDKGQYIRKCKYCGRDLKIGSPYNICSDCYNNRNYYDYYYESAYKPWNQ
ncbi:MAG: hypothetical protein K6E10_08795 [Eubacterium sp.]|nr:hypothetical protein [Eubacterium sp.]